MEDVNPLRLPAISMASSERKSELARKYMKFAIIQKSMTSIQIKLHHVVFVNNSGEARRSDTAMFGNQNAHHVIQPQCKGLKSTILKQKC